MRRGFKAKRTVFWPGSGFSLGSQVDPPNRPPLGLNFFEDEKVLERLPDYKTLNRLWTLAKKPRELEPFWCHLDQAFNCDTSVHSDEQAMFGNLLHESKKVRSEGRAVLWHTGRVLQGRFQQRLPSDTQSLVELMKLSSRLPPFLRGQPTLFLASTFLQEPLQRSLRNPKEGTNP